ncbi:MAG: S41 family peptidase [Candidatus Aminicenantes bacterium]|nr:S41 family peptidase [Candidatus Aminicenantes bacterium]
MDQPKKVAVLRFGNMMGYREAMEYVASAMDSKTAAAWANSNYERFNKKKPPENLKETIAGIPSATETFMSLAADMKKAGTETLLIDVRGNPGGNSFITDILIYFLYGWKIRDSVCNTVTIQKFSELYFMNYAQPTIDVFSKFYAFPLTVEDYAFREYGRADQFEPAELERYATFASEKKRGTYEGFYRPRNIIVLTSSKTFSSAYWLAADLTKAGAKLVGIPSGQAGNSFGDVLSFRLKNSGLAGGVSYRQFLKFPDDQAKGKILRPDFELTYEKLRQFDFDPNAEILWALELFSSE